MRTATVRQLRNQYREVLGWVASGEEVAISQRGQIIARLVPESAKKARRVDWSKSAAIRMDKAALPRLRTEETAALVAESQGRY
jgi:antitoxin (DNA-binding transcriptional repressor) of toxin-antitoxin stability system